MQEAPPVLIRQHVAAVEQQGAAASVRGHWTHTLVRRRPRACRLCVMSGEHAWVAVVRLLGCCGRGAEGTLSMHTEHAH